ncbi:glutathione S-transferase family protein [Maricaulis sp. CAU 1757]
MTQRVRIHGDLSSGNCLKVKWVADYLGRPYDWVDVDVAGGETRTEDFLALNPAGQVPCLEAADGHVLAQSNAILFYLAEGSDLIPADAFERAKMLEWMFWEQYSHEPYIAVRRFHKRYSGMADEDIDPALLAKGRRALGVMEMRLLSRDFMVRDRLTLADVSLVAYTRMADEGGFDLDEFLAVRGWIARVEQALSIPPGEGRVRPLSPVGASG